MNCKLGKEGFHKLIKVLEFRFSYLKWHFCLLKSLVTLKIRILTLIFTFVTILGLKTFCLSCFLLFNQNLFFCYSKTPIFFQAWHFLQELLLQYGLPLLAKLQMLVPYVLESCMSQQDHLRSLQLLTCLPFPFRSQFPVLLYHP